jgi:hypothetical protein
MFKKGNKLGRPHGKTNKTPFCLPTVIKTMFPDREANLTRRIESLASEKVSPGITMLKKHLAGERITQRQAIIAMCCECMGYYRDGKNDCECPFCALYPYMPYRLREK